MLCSQYEKSARLMINKWRKKYVDNIYVNDFIEYFVKQWLSPMFQFEIDDFVIGQNIIDGYAWRPTF